MAQPVVISLELASRRTESQPGWETETFVLASTARGGPGESRQLALQPDDVIELVLDNGESLLVAAEDAGRYLGMPQGRGGRMPARCCMWPACCARRGLNCRRRPAGTGWGAGCCGP